MTPDKLRWRSIALVLLPFATGYFLTHVYRAINALISPDLAAELSLSPAELGLSTSVFFLSFAVVQLPLGLYIDRYGPRRVQGLLLPVAALGALMFAASPDVIGLIVARSLMGLGTAAAMMAGLKALAMNFPPARLPLLNGAFIAFGALGAISASVPAKWLLELAGWRGLFVLLAVVTVASALLICFAAPKDLQGNPALRPKPSPNFRAIVLHADFVRLAPLSGFCVGMAWSIHGLWAASWLADIEGLNSSEVAWHLLSMGIWLCVGALAFGLIADQLQRRGVSLQKIIFAMAMIFMVSELALILRWPAPTYLLFGAIAAMGAATVLSFSAIGQLFPKETVAQANAALNVVHVSTAFVLQYVTGLIIQRWPSADGHTPLAAYQAAFGFGLVLQIISLVLFLWPVRDTERSAKVIGPAELRFWRRAALASALASIVLGGAVAATNVRANARFYETVDTKAERRAAFDAEVGYLLSRFVENVRSLSSDAVVVRARWSEALDFMTRAAARALSETARDSFAQIGSSTVMIEILSVARRSDDLFEVRWKERIFQSGELDRTQDFVGKFTIVVRPSNSGSFNPFGLYVDHFTWNATPALEPSTFEKHRL